MEFSEEVIDDCKYYNFYTFPVIYQWIIADGIGNVNTKIIHA